MEIKWTWNFLETVGAVLLFMVILYVLVKILGTLWITGKFKGWW